MRLNHKPRAVLVCLDDIQRRLLDSGDISAAHSTTTPGNASQIAQGSMPRDGDAEAHSRSETEEDGEESVELMAWKQARGLPCPPALAVGMCL
jgi:hypothetical protein